MTTKTCTHHFVIETAAGPTSLGKCQKCGITKPFQNYVEGGHFGRTGYKARTSDASW